MSSYIKCPNCVKESLEVPLRQDGEFMICPLCESEY